MIPKKILEYLDSHGARYQVRKHARVVTAQELAASLDVTGFQVAKTVIVDADGKRWMAVLPAPELVDTARLAEALGAKRVRLAPEEEFARLFADCEPGAEPPFGRLYGVPAIMEACLADAKRLLFRAGSHEEAIEMEALAYADLERPQVTSFAVRPWAPAQPHAEAQV
ncbi:MAG: YbaK/EbsC family protein [Myxococcales bacterium]|nr:YbaK/EbsC family protein [Myxococcales bacterium]